MCGLLTWLSRGQTVNRTRLEAGLSALRHRGPDASGVVVLDLPTPQLGLVSIGFAHARLAIIDPSPDANQPFRRGDHVICYNGEIYNHRELAARFRIASRSTASDTEVLLSLLATVGPSVLAEARGMWAFTWLDTARRRLIAARDRYGKKPLFYVAGSSDIILASEISALRAVLGGCFTLQDEALATFLAQGWLLPQSDGTTHLQDVREVRPGHALVIDLDTWTFNEVPLDGLWPASPPSRDLADCLAQAVADRLVSDRPVGLLLSGGVDSMLILSLLAAQGALDRVTCFIGDAGKSNDTIYARSCIAATGARAVEIPLDYGPASTDDFLAVCRSQEKPFPLIGNVLGMPALYRAMADHGVRVALDGTGADELFGGYWSRYAGFAMRDAARAGDTAWLTAVRAGGMLPPELSSASDEALLQGPLPCPANSHSLEADCRWLSSAGVALIAEALPGDPLVGFAGSLPEALLRDARLGRMQEWLWQNDRNAMAAGVENRSPFLDHRLAAWVSTPYHAKFNCSRNKCELRVLFDQFIPLPSVKRLEKQGFRWVYGRFLRQNRRWIAELIHGSALVRRVCRIDALMADLDEISADEPLLQRLIVLAGLEATGAVNGA